MTQAPAMPAHAIAPADITGLLLAGGRGSRMGGVDKGLQPFNGEPLALHAIRRLRPQVGALMLNANRNLKDYEAFGARVHADILADYPGPLAGFLTGLVHCRTPWLLTVPCDTPLFPPDLAARLAEAAATGDAEIAMAVAPEASETEGAAPVLRPQPVFCLLRADLLDSLRRYTEAGGRKVQAWAAQHRTVRVPFDRPGDAPDAFFNANTLAELHALENR
ncbi:MULTISPECIES: molybdenum cofactor guanylyltransferase MobA [Variovorax]|jgi:molybdenum cofactor guanylyltransferase|uniref:molybdenum cofactor guanylyltransferase MobA n=2 Tax=Comamonadaceae TaxID=80864 RepID=UPI000A87F321|nr:molybdenum cofactor guanylyltransferase MobA [Variovorax paradoxus]MBN8754904.1 molybdenum cofactor guanylyltransferase MobA [Variovorax sp.]UKI05202.1 molybdenum cofactor guanylyltransferase MobA [Variovorax paradoxus]